MPQSAPNQEQLVSALVAHTIEVAKNEEAELKLKWEVDRLLCLSRQTSGCKRARDVLQTMLHS
eukprot:15473529-Alexandrium_andersonii.AAC.1